MKKIIYLTILLLICGLLQAVSQPFEMPLYKGDGVGEIAAGGEWEPSLTVYLPAEPDGRAVVICPGGGYKGLSMGHEGHAVAKWFNERGIAGIVLRYRMPRGRAEVPLQDVRETLSVVRRNATGWSVDPGKVGIIGFSAGGHLAATSLTLLPEGERPGFGVLVYPVVTMSGPEMHGGSRFNLMGRTPDEQTKQLYSPELHITGQTPPVFLALCSDDRGVKPRNSTMFYDALTSAGVPAEMHIYPEGGHGWGFCNTTFGYYDQMKAALARWLEWLDKNE